MNSQLPLVSICIPTYNAEDFLGSMLESVLNQDYDNIEIIVSDNASEDNTWAIAETFLVYNNLKLYRNIENIGGEANFNKCLDLANGKYVALLHSDDLYSNDMVRAQINAFEENPELSVVFSNFKFINEYDEVIKENIIDNNFRFNEVLDFRYFISQILTSYGTILSTPSAMIKREILESENFFNWEKYGTAADLNMWLSLCEISPILYLRKAHFSWRVSRSQGSYTTRRFRIDESDYMKVINSYIAKYGVDFFNPKDVLMYRFYRSLDYQRCLLNANLLGVKIERLENGLSVSGILLLVGKVKFKFLLYYIFSYTINVLHLYKIFRTFILKLYSK
jgi:glycosyltransferase involved in cell wall biosynthesis